MRSVFGQRRPAPSPSRTRSARWPPPAAAQLVADPAARAPGPGNGAPRRALINSFGAGGNFLAAVIESADGVDAPPAIRRAAARAFARDPRPFRRVRSVRRRLARPLRALPRAGARGPDRRASASRRRRPWRWATEFRSRAWRSATAVRSSPTRASSSRRACGRPTSRASSSTTRSGARAGDLLASAETEQVVIQASGELLVTLPSGLRRSCARRSSSYQESTEEPDAMKAGRARAARQPALPSLPRALRLVLLVVFYFVVASRPVNDKVIVPFTAGVAAASARRS